MRTTALLAAALAVGVLAPAAAQSPAAAPDAWTIDQSHTTAGFSVKHMMVTNVHGTFGKVDGTITYDGKDVSTIAADITIDAASVNTNNERRDTHLRSADFFDVENHPTITFRSKRVEKAGDGRFRLVGDLTIRGVTKEVALDVEGPSPVINAGRVFKVGASATTTINRQDFGLTWNRMLEAGGVTVGDEVKITLEIEANKPNPNAPPPSAQGR
ncbi:MAG TPA: YceI family protein [Vicinamibacterales bacterium]